MFSLVNFSEFKEIYETVRVWDDVVSRSRTAWFWISRDFVNYQKLCLEKSAIEFEDLSFFVKDGDDFVGLCIFVVTSVKYDGKYFREASFSGTDLPWPCVVYRGDGQQEAVEKYIFDEIDRRALEHNVAAVRLFSSPPNDDLPIDDINKIFEKITTRSGYLDGSYYSHIVNINDGTLSLVRDRFRRYYNKFIRNYDVYSLSGSEITTDLISKYARLHEKDAGRYVREIATYEAQAKTAINGNGFWMIVKNKDNQSIVGILQIILSKNHCYGGSVAIDPDYQNDNISCLLHWKIIEKLMADGVKTYDLGGPAYSPPSFLNQPTEKNKGISFFKDGWTRGQTKKVFSVCKPLSDDYIDYFFQEKSNGLKLFLKLSG